MAEKYDNWCASLPRVPGIDGKSYCVFHAPKEEEPPEDYNSAFNQEVYKWIDQSKQDEAPCILRGAIFPGEISFTQYGKDNPLPELDFTETVFKGRVDFEQCLFGGPPDFSKAIFNEGATFGDAHFEGGANFSQAIFKEYAQFWRAQFRRETLFQWTLFSGGATFSWACFKYYTSFHNAVFEGEAGFWEASFFGDANFLGTGFRKRVYFSEAQFHFRCEFNDTRFEAESYFALTHLGKATFKNSQFSKPAFFQKTQFDGCSLIGCFIGERLEFDQAFLRRVSLSGVSVERLKFIDCKWPHVGRNKTIFDARKAFGRGYFVLDDAGRAEPWGEDGPPEPGALADLFRRLKKVANEERDHALAGDWHFMEKEMQRRKYWKDLVRQGKESKFGIALLDLLTWLVLGAYRLLCGFGERPLRALVCLLALAGLPFLLADLFPGQPLNYLPIVKAEYTEAATAWEKFITGAWRYLVLPFQAGLFALAVRNRMRR